MSKVGLYVAETVIAFTLLVLAAYWMKKRGVLKQEDSALFARLLTQAVLPATILYQLWTHPMSSESFTPVLVMFLSGTAALAISWLAGVLLKFDRESTGALMIVSSFGSSALIGYPIIQTPSRTTLALAEASSSASWVWACRSLSFARPCHVFRGDLPGTEDLKKTGERVFHVAHIDSSRPWACRSPTAHSGRNALVDTLREP